MAELLVMKQGNGDGPGQYQKGDVVLTMDDNHPWTPRELTEFIVIKMPGVARADVQHLSASGPRRQFHLDVDSLGLTQGAVEVGKDVQLDVLQAALVNKMSDVIPSLVAVDQ